MDIALLVVRLIVGLGFAAHGAQKLFGAFGGYGLAGTGGWMESIGWKPGKLFAFAAGASELVGGVLVAAGFLGPVGPMFMIAPMVVAIAVHAPNGFFITKNGYEFALTELLFAVLFAYVGFGAYSVDDATGLVGMFTPVIATGAVVLGFVGGLVNIALRKKPSPQPSAN